MRPALSFDGTTLYWSSAFRDGNAGFMFDIWSASRRKLTEDSQKNRDQQIRKRIAISAVQRALETRIATEAWRAAVARDWAPAMDGEIWLESTGMGPTACLTSPGG
jgi:hypothetical protein